MHEIKLPKNHPKTKKRPRSKRAAVCRPARSVSTPIDLSNWPDVMTMESVREPPLRRLPSQGSCAAGSKAALGDEATLSISLTASALPVTRMPSQGPRAAGGKKRDADGPAIGAPADGDLSISLTADALPVKRMPSQGTRAAGSKKEELSISLAAEEMPSVRAPSQGSRAAGLKSRSVEMSG